MTRGGGWRHAATGLMALWLAAAPARSQDAPPRQVLTATYVSFALAVLCGVYLIIIAGWVILAIGAAYLIGADPATRSRRAPDC